VIVVTFTGREKHGSALSCIRVTISGPALAATLIKDKVCGGEAHWLFWDSLIGDVHKNLARKFCIGWPNIGALDECNPRCSGGSKFLLQIKECAGNPNKSRSQKEFSALFERT